jgi:hypothetical protein
LIVHLCKRSFRVSISDMSRLRFST